jgi:GNAT superfamily N-acetyltransferase
MNYELQIKNFSELDIEERAQLGNLVNPNGIFPIWLNDEQGLLERYASLAKNEDKIISWAAVDINKDEFNAVGAFTKSEYRGNGIATACLNHVLSYAHQELKRNRRCSLMYDQEFKELFKPVIENNGFSPSSATLVIQI